MIRLLARLIAAVCSPNNLLFSLCAVQTNRRYTDSGPPEQKIIYSTSPGPDLPTDTTPRARSVLGGPSPREGNALGFRRTFEAQGLGAHVARRARTAAPGPRSTRSFVSRPHKSRGDPRSRSGLQCGQAIVREGAQRLGIIYQMHFFRTFACPGRLARVVSRALGCGARRGGACTPRRKCGSWPGSVARALGIQIRAIWQGIKESLSTPPSLVGLWKPHNISFFL